MTHVCYAAIIGLFQTMVTYWSTVHEHFAEWAKIAWATPLAIFIGREFGARLYTVREANEATWVEQ